MWKFLKRRFNERSFWIAIGGGITAASALPHPWGAVFLGSAILAALTPDGPIKK